MRSKRYDPLAPENVLAALLRMAAEQASRRNVKGSRRPREVVDRVQATKRKLAMRRVREAWKRRQAAKPRGVKRTAEYGERLADRMVKAMAPGLWYGQRDITRAMGLPRGHNAKLLQELWPRRWVERRRNPAYRGAAKMAQCRPGGGAEPIWLYRLTRLGELHREAVLMVAG